MSILTTTPLEQIEERHLIALIENRVQESRDLEFKRDDIGRDDRAKKEFLKDVTAFANTAGGHLVIGIEEADGVAANICGITSPSADEEIRRLESILENGVEPRLVGVRIHPVTLSAGGYALVIRVPVSWNPPHRVAFDRQNRFYARNSGGAYELSVEQLRAVFLGGAELERRLMEFRVERLARLDTGVRGFRVESDGRLVLHIVPITPQPAAIDLRAVQANPLKFAPPGGMGMNWRINFDGIVLYTAQSEAQSVPAYTQVFRDVALRQFEVALSRVAEGGLDDAPLLLAPSPAC
jgi:hypothetical protein